jgi:hypothetical protein
LEFGWCHDRAVMCTAGDLLRDSTAFNAPSPDVKTSPWLRVEPHLNTIAEATERVRTYAESDWGSREAMRPESGYFDEDNKPRARSASQPARHREGVAMAGIGDYPDQWAIQLTSREQRQVIADAGGN